MAGQSIGKMSATLTADINQFQQQLNTARGQLGEFVKSSQAAGAEIGRGLFGAFAPQLMGLASIGGFISGLKTFADAMHEVVMESRKLGMSVAEIQQLQYAARKSGIEFTAVEHGIARLRKTITEAFIGNKEAADSLNALHLNAEKMIGMGPIGQLEMFSEGLGKIHNRSVQVAIAMKVLGKSAQEAMEFLNMMREGKYKNAPIIEPAIVEGADAARGAIKGGAGKLQAAFLNGIFQAAGLINDALGNKHAFDAVYDPARPIGGSIEAKAAREFARMMKELEAKGRPTPSISPAPFADRNSAAAYEAIAKAQAALVQRDIEAQRLAEIAGNTKRTVELLANPKDGGKVVAGNIGP